MITIIAPRERQVFQKGEWYVFYDPINVKWIKVNEAGKVIIEALEENPDLDAALEGLKKTFDLDEGKIRQFVDYLVGKAGYLHIDTYKETGIDFSNKQATPSTLYIHPTFACNLNCVYCYNLDDRRKRRSVMDYAELTLDEYKRLFEEAKELGIKSLIFTGGEPLKRDDVFDLAAMAKEMNFHTSIISNGTLVTQENAPAIAKWFDRVSVSIDSCKEEENDAMRGKGSFIRTLYGIRLLLAAGARVSCLGVAHKGNIDSMDESWDYFVRQLGCLSFVPQLFIPSHEKLADNGELDAFIARYTEYRNRVNRENGIYGRQEIKNLCGMCAGEVAIGADGGVYPCQSLLKEEFCSGNTRDDSLGDILAKSPVFQKLLDLSVDDLDHCRDCDIKYLCGGGCRAFHYEIYKDLTRTDARFCTINRTVTIENMFESAVHSNRDNAALPGESPTVPSCM